jgi:PAS domain S-box-containing protein
MPTILRYGIALLSVAIALGLDFFLLRHFEAILTPFLFAIAATVWYAGTGPGILTIVLSVLSLNYFLLRPFFSFSPISYADLVYLTFCLFCALAVGWFSAVQRRTEQELRLARDELEVKVLERTANLQRSEGHLAEAQRLSHSGVSAYNETTILYGSEETYRIWGFDPAQGVPSFEAIFQRVHPDDRDRHRAQVQSALDKKSGYSIAYRIVLPDGTVKHLESIGQPVFSASGELVEVVATQMDVTERTRAADALRESEHKLRQIIDTIPTHVVRYQPDGAADFMNQTFCEFVGPGVGFDNLRSVVHPEDYPKRSRDWDAHVAAAEPYDIEMRLRRADGVYRWHRSRRVPLRDANGAIVNWYGAGHDIDDQKRAEQALRRSESYLAEAQRLSHTGSSAYNEREILYWSEEAFRIFGFDPLQGIPSREAVWQRIHPDDVDRMNENIERGVREKTSFTNAFRFMLPDGTVKHIESLNNPVFSASGELLEIVGTPIDVTERKCVEDALRESEYKLRQIVDAIPGLLWSLAPDGEPTHFNQRVLDYFGTPFEDFKHGGWLAFIHPDDRLETQRVFSHAIQTGTSYQDVLRLRRADGEYRWHRSRGDPLSDRQGNIIQWFGLSVDIDEAKKAEDRLRRSESHLAEAQLELAHANRVATMGQLTSSIAHEVNQPITAAVTYALAARRFLSAEPPNFREVGDALSLIIKEGNRAGEVVGRIRALVTKAPARKDTVEINDAILEAIALTRTEAANNCVSVRTQLSEDLPRLQGDRVQLQQVLLNLIINAIEAMRDISEGERELLISSRSEPDGVSVEVRDSGPGLAPANLDRVFEAFYTTKPSGLGLGLSICRSIIEAHNGRLWASPNVPRGAVFGFTMPAHPGAES